MTHSTARNTLLVAALIAFGAGCTPSAQPGGSTSQDTTTTETTSRPPHLAKGAEGIDVSEAQGNINWTEVSGAGIAFVFIKATQGETYVDANFKTNWTQAKEQGLSQGAYHFFCPGQDGKTQAAHFLNNVDLSDAELSPVVDIETLDATGCPDATGVPSPEIISELQAWLTAVQDGTGKTPMIYTDLGFWNTSIHTDQFSDYPLWIAAWDPGEPKLPADWTSWHFWQHSDSGRVKGIDGPVDLDVYSGPMETMETR